MGRPPSSKAHSPCGYPCRTWALLHRAGAGVSGCYRVLPPIASQERFGPQRGSPAHAGRFLAREADDPRAGLGCDSARPTRPGEVRQGLTGTQRQRFGHTATDRIRCHRQCLGDLIARHRFCGQVIGVFGEMISAILVTCCRLFW